MPIIISLRSQQEQLSVGSRYEVEVHIEDAPRLTAFTCELEFDENLLEPLEAVPGDFFGNDALFIEDSEFQRRERNLLSLGVALKGDNTGICGSDVVFRVVFQAVRESLNRGNRVGHSPAMVKLHVDHHDVPLINSALKKQVREPH